MLVRETRNVETSLGSLRVKVVTLPGGRIRWKPEHDDVQAAADTHQLDYLTAHRRVARELAELFGGGDG